MGRLISAPFFQRIHMLTREYKALRSRARLKTAPTVEPVSASDLIQHSRLLASEDTSELTRKLKAARKLAEDYTGRAFLSQVWQLSYDAQGFGPHDNFWYTETPSASYYAALPQVIVLPRPPLITLDSIKYYPDATHTETTYATTNVAAITSDKENPGRLMLKTGKVWPTDLRAVESIVFEFTCGYGTLAEHVPSGICEGILMWAAYLYEQREGAPSDNAGGAVVLNHGGYIPAGVRTILQPYIVGRI
jgi:hypothetical protein